MNRNILVVMNGVTVVGLASALFHFVYSYALAPAAGFATPGLASMQDGSLIFYALLLPALVGLGSFFVYRVISAHFQDAAQTLFLFLVALVGTALTILAAVVFQTRGLIEITVLHLLYIASFGWFIPRAWVR